MGLAGTLLVTLLIIFVIMAVVSLVLIKTKKTDVFYGMPFFMDLAALILFALSQIISIDLPYVIEDIIGTTFLILPFIALIYFIVFSITIKILRLKNIVKTEPKRIWKILGVIGFILSVIYLILAILAAILMYYLVMAIFDRLEKFFSQF